MTISDWVVIIAILLAPLLAIQIQKYLENQRDKKEKKMKLFRTLMATRAMPLYAQHVEALNMIDIEFYENKKVTDAWKLLLDNFANYPTDSTKQNYQSRLDSSIKASNELLADLLYEMAKSLNYSFDKVHLKRGAYIPRGHAESMVDQEIIRRSLVGVFSGQLPIPIKIIDTEKEEDKGKKEAKVLR